MMNLAEVVTGLEEVLAQQRAATADWITEPKIVKVCEAALALLRLPGWPEWSAAWDHLATELKTPQPKAQLLIHLLLFRSLYALAREMKLQEVVRGTCPPADENEALRAIQLGMELRLKLLEAKLTRVREALSSYRETATATPATTARPRPSPMRSR